MSKLYQLSQVLSEIVAERKPARGTRTLDYQPEAVIDEVVTDALDEINGYFYESVRAHDIGVKDVATFDRDASKYGTIHLNLSNIIMPKFLELVDKKYDIEVSLGDSGKDKKNWASYGERSVYDWITEKWLYYTTSSYEFEMDLVLDFKGGKPSFAVKNTKYSVREPNWVSLQFLSDNTAEPPFVNKQSQKEKPHLAGDEYNAKNVIVPIVKAAPKAVERNGARGLVDVIDQISEDNLRDVIREFFDYVDFNYNPKNYNRQGEPTYKK